MKTTYRRYTWIGNKIAEGDMQKLHRLKIETNRPITAMVAEAVKEYVGRKEKEKDTSPSA